MLQDLYFFLSISIFYDIELLTFATKAIISYQEQLYLILTTNFLEVQQIICCKIVFS